MRWKRKSFNFRFNKGFNKGFNKVPATGERRKQRKSKALGSACKGS